MNEGTDILVVEDVMLTNPATVFQSRGLAHGAKLMKQHRVNSLLVTDKNRRLMGIVTKEMLEEQYHEEEMLLQHIMQPAKASAAPGQPITEAVELMKTHNLSHLPVVDRDGLLAGLVTNSSLIDALLKQI